MDLIIIVAQQPTSPTPMSSSVRHFNPTSYHGASFASVLLEKDSRESFQRQIVMALARIPALPAPARLSRWQALKIALVGRG
jgi:hypothetical protein